MKPVEAISPTDWMSDEPTRRVLAALQASGQPARFVGGCVRDAVVGRLATDIDIATPLPPDQVIAALEKAGLKAIPTGIEHGTVTAVAQGFAYEVTTLRHDVETDGRHAVVAFTDRWEEDAARRDFTMNALYADADGTLYDPTGGLSDLREGWVRFIGNPAARIAEDALRILRFFRFYAWYGIGQPDAAAIAACSSAKDDLTSLSAERVWHELGRILAAPEPAGVLSLLGSSGILQVVLPEATRLEAVQLLALLEASADIEPDPILRLAAAVAVPAGEASAMVKALADRLKLSGAERKKLATLLDPAIAIEPEMDDKAVRRALYRLGLQGFMDRVFLAWASLGPNADFRPQLRLAGRSEVPVFPLRGADALEIGVPAGKRVGELLKAVEDWWIDGDFQARRDACLARLRTFAGADAPKKPAPAKKKAPAKTSPAKKKKAPAKKA